MFTDDCCSLNTKDCFSKFALDVLGHVSGITIKNENIKKLIFVDKHYRAMAYMLRHWIPNPGVPGSKPLDGSNVDSAFHPFKFDQLSTKNCWELNGKSKISLRSGSVALRQLNPIHEKGP